MDGWRPDAAWPEEGRVEFSDYTVRYRPGLDLVLKGLSFTIQPGEKVRTPLCLKIAFHTIHLAMVIVTDRNLWGLCPQNPAETQAMHFTPGCRWELWVALAPASHP